MMAMIREAVVLCVAMGITVLWCEVAAAGKTSLTFQGGEIQPYEYPIESSSQDAVASKSSAPILSLRVGSGVTSRLQVALTTQHWTGEGMNNLTRIPEAPDEQIDSRLVPVSPGVRVLLGPHHERFRLYLGLAPTLVILHTKVTTGPDFFGEPATVRSATHVAPGGMFDAAFDVSLGSRLGLQVTVMYLLSSSFDNSEQLVGNRDFEGLRQVSVLGGLRIDVF